MKKTTRTLNVTEDVHKRVRLAAVTADMKIAVYVEAALLLALNRPDEVKQLAAGRTSSEEQPATG